MNGRAKAAITKAAMAHPLVEEVQDEGDMLIVWLRPGFAYPDGVRDEDQASDSWISTLAPWTIADFRYQIAQVKAVKEVPGGLVRSNG